MTATFESGAWVFVPRYSGAKACGYCTGHGATYSVGREPHPSPRIHPGAMPPRYRVDVRRRPEVGLLEIFCGECIGTGSA